MSFQIGTPTGAAAVLPTGSVTVELFNSVTTFGPKTMGNNGMRRISVTPTHDQAFTLTASHSVDGGTTWIIFYNEVQGIPDPNTITGPIDFLTDTYLDVKLEATNGGTDQTVWNVLLMGFESRLSGT